MKEDESSASELVCKQAVSEKNKDTNVFRNEDLAH